MGALMHWIEQIAERRAAQAVARGELQGLPGEGRPLDPERLRETTEDVLHRIMADAGAVPVEFTIARQIEAARAALPASGPERRAALAQIAALEVRHGIARDARRRFMR